MSSIETDIITHECICGSNMFKVCVVFDDYEIGGYGLDMSCWVCDSKYKAPTPLDRPEE